MILGSPFGHSGRFGDARARLANSVAPRSLRPIVFRDPSTDPIDDPSGGDLVRQLERLAQLRRTGDLSTDEYEAAKRSLLSGGKS